MKNIFVINVGHTFAHSPGRFNKTLLQNNTNYFANRPGFDVRTTEVGKKYNLEEVEKYKWADIIIYSIEMINPLNY